MRKVDHWIGFWEDVEVVAGRDEGERANDPG
jgi:hypothetical protein